MSSPNSKDVSNDINQYLDPVDVKLTYKKRDEKLSKFSELMNSLSSIEDKKKALWKEIYENAITDRDNAYMLYVTLYVQIMGKDETTHSILGQVINKYLERMSKSNDQLIKLAELIANAESNQKEVNPEDMYNLINNKQ